MPNLLSHSSTAKAGPAKQTNSWVDSPTTFLYFTKKFNENHPVGLKLE